MKTIQALLDSRGSREIYSVRPEATVFEAVSRMTELNIGAIIVSEGESILGIMTERDYLRFVADQGRTARNTPVSELMTRRLLFITPTVEIDEAMAIMTEKRVRHLPVMHDGMLIDIISIGDLVKQIVENQRAHIAILETYINDPYPGSGAR